MTTYEKVPFTIAMGNIVSKRIVDLLISDVFIFAALTLEVSVTSRILAENFRNCLRSALITFYSHFVIIRNESTPIKKEFKAKNQSNPNLFH